MKTIPDYRALMILCFCIGFLIGLGVGVLL